MKVANRKYKVSLCFTQTDFPFGQSASHIPGTLCAIVD